MSELRVLDNRSSAQDSRRSEALNDTRDYLASYVSMTDAALDAVTVWIAHTHCIEAADTTPYIHVTSTQPRSGKTRLLEACELVVRSPLRTADATEAALFHIISQGVTTLLLDEVDTVFGGGKSREPLRALLNASYRRGTPVQRVKGNRVQSFDVFGAKMIAGIGDVPSTVADRSIRIVMERKEAGQMVSRFVMRDVEERAEALKACLKQSFAPSPSNLPFLRALVNARVELPDWLNDRAADSWEPLLQVASVVGGGWHERTLEASKVLSGEERSMVEVIRS